MWARIDHGLVAEMSDVDPAGRFHESLEWVLADPGVVPGWSFDGTQFNPPAPRPQPPPSTQISPLQFIARFTAAETGAIAQAALSNAAMLMWLVQASAASYIDLADPRTKAGLDSLVAAGLLTASRETAILTP